MKWLISVVAVTGVMIASSRFTIGQVGKTEITKMAIRQSRISLAHL